MQKNARLCKKTMAETNTLTFNAVEELQTLLNEEITDPNNDRDGNARWIYTIPINFDLAQYPRIHIQEISALHNGYGLGTNQRQVDTVIQISVFNHVDGKFDVDNDNEKEESREVVSFLTQKITELLNSNQARFKDEDNCINYFVTINETLTQNSKNSVIQNNIEAELRSVK